MSDIAKVKVVIFVFVAWLAGISAMISAFGGYPFWRTLLAVVGSYVALLLTNIGYERLHRRFFQQ